MKILYCHNFYQQTGGEDRVFYDECTMLKEYGHDVQTWTVHNDKLQSMGKLTAVKKTLWNSESYRTLTEKLKKFQPQVVHFGNTFPLISPASYWACKKQGASVVQTLHNFRIVCPSAGLFRNNDLCHDCVGKLFALPGVRNGCYRGSKLATGVTALMASWHRIYGTWHKAVDAFITLTDFSRKIFIEGGLPEDKLVIKPNFVADPEKAFSSDFPREGAIFVGRLVAEKGVDLILNVWKNLDENIRLTIVGDGPMKQEVQAAAENDSRINWIPSLEHSEVLMKMRQAVVCLVPSRFYETFGLTTVESAAVGTPAIGSDIGATTEIIDHEKTGMLFSSGDWEMLKSSILRVVGDREFAADLGQRAREKFVQRYTKEANHGLLMDVYHSVL